jgi:metacaspase-1
MSYPGQSSSTGGNIHHQNQNSYQQPPPFQPTQQYYQPQQQYQPTYPQQGQYISPQPVQQVQNYGPPPNGYPQQFQHQGPIAHEPTIHWQAPPAQYMQQNQQYISSCNGRKKALLIGINYTGTSSALAGCVNDVKIMRDFLINGFGWPGDQQTILCLTDDNHNPAFQPTRQNILQAMQWLVRGWYT